MNQLHRVPSGQGGVVQLRPPYNFSIQFEHHRAGVEAEVAQQVGRSGGPRNPPGLPIHHDLEFVHLFSTPGANMESVAAAGSSACQSARMAATP